LGKDGGGEHTNWASMFLKSILPPLFTFVSSDFDHLSLIIDL
jgi:hypothetical protein